MKERERERSKEKEREKERWKEKERDKERWKEKERDKGEGKTGININIEKGKVFSPENRVRTRD